MSSQSVQHNLFRHTDIIVALGIISIVVMMIIPLPPTLLDILIVFNITCSLVVLLVAMYNNEPLDFSIFPSLLLVLTLSVGVKHLLYAVNSFTCMPVKSSINLVILS